MKNNIKYYTTLSRINPKYLPFDIFPTRGECIFKKRVKVHINPSGTSHKFIDTPYGKISYKVITVLDEPNPHFVVVISDEEGEVVSRRFDQLPSEFNVNIFRPYTFLDRVKDFLRWR